MTITPQVIEQVDFSEKFRGYDPDEVDDFLERVGATIAELNKSLHDVTHRAEVAERAVAELKATAAPASGSAVAGGGGPVEPRDDGAEVMATARALVVAQRAADQAVAEARAEADQLLQDARTEADRLHADAVAESERVRRDAHEAAEKSTARVAIEVEREFAERRAAALAGIETIESDRDRIEEQVTAARSRFETHLAALAEVHRSIGEIVDDPTGLFRPEPGVSGRGPSIAADAGGGANETAATANTTTERPVREDVDAGYTTTEPSGGVEADTAFSFDDTWSASGPVESEPADGSGFSGFSAPGDAHQESAFTADPGDAAAFTPSPFDTADDEVQAFREPARAVDVDWLESGGSSSVSASDPWGPGSWSDLEAFHPAEPSGEATSSPSEDKYTRELKLAVNQPDGAEGDDQMAAFFDADEPPKARRFGRRS
ncbi:MAG: DivIVA domain-containing protein [Microthrixaceae bacterium]